MGSEKDTYLIGEGRGNTMTQYTAHSEFTPNRINRIQNSADWSAIELNVQTNLGGTIK